MSDDNRPRMLVKRYDAATYYCVFCHNKLDERKGVLYHPAKRWKWFAWVDINCPHAGVFCDHPDITDEYLRPDIKRQPSDL